MYLFTIWSGLVALSTLKKEFDPTIIPGKYLRERSESEAV